MFEVLQLTISLVVLIILCMYLFYQNRDLKKTLNTMSSAIEELEKTKRERDKMIREVALLETWKQVHTG